MLLEPSPIFCPGMSDDIPSCLADSLYGFSAAPAWHTCAKTNKMRASMDGGPESKIVIHKPIAGREALDQPQRCHDVLVQEELVHLCNHLPEIQWPHTQLTHLPINYEDRYLLVGFEIPVGEQNAAVVISTFPVSRVVNIPIIAYFPVQKSPWMTCSLLSSSSSSFAFATTALNTSSESLRNGKSSDCQMRLS